MLKSRHPNSKKGERKRGDNKREKKETEIEKGGKKKKKNEANKNATETIDTQISKKQKNVYNVRNTIYKTF